MCGEFQSDTMSLFFVNKIYGMSQIIRESEEPEQFLNYLSCMSFHKTEDRGCN